MDYLIVFGWSLVGSVVSLIGGLLLLKNKQVRTVAVRYGVPFGAGALLAAAFLGLLPEAVEGGGAHSAVAWALGGFLTFFLLERLLGWFHHHEDHHHDNVHGAKDARHRKLIVVGDTIHNAIDGAALGAAFLVSPAAGIGAAIAIAAHEIPQEIGDFSLLLGKGMKPKRVLLVNLLSALATVVTALATYALGDFYSLDASPLLAIAAGFFIYVAASDIIPDIHEKGRREGNVQAVMLLVGVAALAVVIFLTPHTHGEGSHEGHDESTTHNHESHDDGHEHDDDEHEHDSHQHNQDELYE